MTIKSLQYAKVNKARKNPCVNPLLARDDSVLSEAADVDIYQFNKLDCKELTLEEILSLESDKEVNNENMKLYLIFNMHRILISLGGFLKNRQDK